MGARLDEQQREECRRSERPLERKLDDEELDEIVLSCLALNWAPEQIAGRLKALFPDQPERHLDLELYFADPGCPHRRGTNENTNCLIRQYFPNGTDFRDVSRQQVRADEKRLNDRPRECLGFRTPNEVFFDEHRGNNCD